MPPLEEYLKNADRIAQEVVNTRGDRRTSTARFVLKFLLTERIVLTIIPVNRAAVLMSGWLRKGPHCQCDLEDSAYCWSSRLFSAYFAAKSLNR